MDGQGFCLWFAGHGTTNCKWLLVQDIRHSRCCGSGDVELPLARCPRVIITKGCYLSCVLVVLHDGTHLAVAFVDALQFDTSVPCISVD